MIIRNYNIQLYFKNSIEIQKERRGYRNIFTSKGKKYLHFINKFIYITTFYVLSILKFVLF